MRDTDDDLGTIYVPAGNYGEVYHTHRECRYVRAGFLVIAASDPRYEQLRESHSMCKRCEYDYDEIPELD